jgi:hypothetical protein
VFAPGEIPSYAQVLAHDLNRRSRGPKLGLFVALFVLLIFAAYFVLATIVQ